MYAINFHFTPPIYSPNPQNSTFSALPQHSPQKLRMHQRRMIALKSLLLERLQKRP